MENSADTYSRIQWQRAETLGALVNGVFLVALCMSIFLEAIQRLVEPQEVKNPKLVCIVGCFGLLSNILGLVLFHDHSHGHGHDHGDDENAAEQGFADHDHEHEHESSYIGDQRGTVASVMPENVVGINSSRTPDHRARGFTKSDETDDTATEAASPFSRKRRGLEGTSRNSRRFSASSRGWAGVESIHIHPATLRQDIIKASQFEEEATSDSDLDNPEAADGQPTERSGLLRHKDRTSNYTDEDTTPIRAPRPTTAEEDLHRSHNHAQPKKNEKGKGGHKHDLNMRGVFLHVMGDALGNIGVIASALIIWLTDYSWRFYVDPGISLVITVIILFSAIPLCKAASRILLQAVPQGMSIDHIKEDIEQLPGVVGSHHLHVWQLSDTKLVASLHIQVDCDIKGEGSERYMRLARQIRKCLHAYGIHSSTIQPEFVPESDVEDNQPTASGHSGSGHESGPSSQAPSLRGNDAPCLLECGEECARGQCCPKQ